MMPGRGRDGLPYDPMRARIPGPDGRPSTSLPAGWSREAAVSGYLISTPARLAPCEGCGNHILACRSGGFRTCADPGPLSLAGEITARLAGRDIYDVITLGLPRRLYLEYRDLTRVICGRNYPVVAAHECPSGRRPAMSA